MVELGDECPICLEILQSSDIYVLNCLHKYHKECIVDWSKRSNLCPLCNGSIAFISDNNKKRIPTKVDRYNNYDTSDDEYRCLSCTIS